MNKTESAPRELRRYQREAIAAWEANEGRGILAMATGTGKTFTALETVSRILEAESSVTIVLIVAPFQHLADQWVEELVERGIRPLRAYESTARWQSEWTIERHKSAALKRPMYVITTYTTLGSEALQGKIAEVVNNTILVADECHYLGSPALRSFMSLAVPYRLGLSATPSRHFDESGTQALMRYFGGIVFSFGMPEAIDQGFLTPYDYYPEAVELEPDEFEEYRTLTEKIGRIAGIASGGSGSANEALQRLLQRRARLLNNSRSKVDWLRQKLLLKTAEELRYTLVYVGDILFAEVSEMIGRELQIPAHAFTSEQSRAERARLLERFQSGDLSVLIAMKCLDEGVDVPPTRSAYFLASTSNPREFVQRRGRILRRAPGKDHAEVFDAIAVPPETSSSANIDPAERAALKSQMSRIQEFGQQARNSVEADAATFKLRLHLDLPLVDTTQGAY